jgi:hypothetical protein
MQDEAAFYGDIVQEKQDDDKAASNQLSSQLVETELLSETHFQSI